MKGIDFLKGFNELAEDIVLEAKKPEQYKRQKPTRGNIIKFAGVAAAVALLVGMAAAGKWGIIHRNTGREIENGNKVSNQMSDIEVLDIREYTDLEVVTDRTKFTPVTQDQSYHPETDMNLYSSNLIMDSYIAEVGETVYIAKSEGDLFAFQKETGTAALACSKTDCEHKTGVGEDCEANLCVLDAQVEGLQYYKGDFYYALANTNSAILYKMSADTKTKQMYVSLLGEKGYGSGDWLIHRDYIYFVADEDGLYRMPVEHPKEKEQLLAMPENSYITIRAYGSYVYFLFSWKNFQAIARYNIESGQIEQFTDMTKQHIPEFLINDGKIYFTEYVDSFNTIFSYDTSTGKREAFLPEEAVKKNTRYSLVSADLDYLYIREASYIWDAGLMRESEAKTCAYTWNKVFAGEVADSSLYQYVRYGIEPFEVFHYEENLWIGSDSNRLYYIDEIYDTQADEYGHNEKLVEGTGKTIISYIDKSELSAEDEILQKHIAGEIDYRESQ